MSNQKRSMFVVFGLMTLVLMFAACGGKAAAERTEPVPTATFTPTPTITVIQFGTPDSDFAGGAAIDGQHAVLIKEHL